MHVGYILLNCDLGSEDYIVEELRQIPEVKNAYLTFGAYDIIAEVHADSQKDFEKTLSSKIRKLARVVSTMTLNVINPEWLLYSNAKTLLKMEKIEYEGTVWVIDHKYPEALVAHSIKRLQDYGIKKEDIVITDAPENVKVKAIVVEIWPHHLDVERVRTTRNESFISGKVTTIELKTDAEGNFIS